MPPPGFVACLATSCNDAGDAAGHGDAGLAVSASALLVSLGIEQRREVCDFTTCLLGGYGAKLSCASGTAVTVAGSQAQCVAQMPLTLRHIRREEPSKPAGATLQALDPETRIRLAPWVQATDNHTAADVLALVFPAAALAQPVFGDTLLLRQTSASPSRRRAIASSPAAWTAAPASGATAGTTSSKTSRRGPAPA